MNEIILLKLGEVVLKGLNRRSFEDKLTSNVRRRLTRCGSFRVYSKQSTIYVEPQGEDCDLDGAYAACRQVFGIVAATRARSCPKDKDAIFHCARNYLGAQLQAARTFKVETKRADKKFPMNSMEISQYVGRSCASTWRSGRRRPTSTAPARAGPGACPSAWAAPPSASSPAASTARRPPI